MVFGVMCMHIINIKRKSNVDYCGNEAGLTSKHKNLLGSER